MAANPEMANATRMRAMRRELERPPAADPPRALSRSRTLVARSPCAARDGSAATACSPAPRATVNTSNAMMTLMEAAKKMAPMMPRRGISTNPAANDPTTAPNVLIA